MPNAPIRGKKSFAIIFEGRKKQTFFCPFDWLVSSAPMQALLAKTHLAFSVIIDLFETNNV